MVSLGGFGDVQSIYMTASRNAYLAESSAYDSRVCEMESTAYQTLPKGCSESQTSNCVQKAFVKGARKKKG